MVLQQELAARRDRIGAGCLVLGDKLEGNHKELLERLDRHARGFERCLDQLVKEGGRSCRALAGHA